MDDPGIDSEDGVQPVADMIGVGDTAVVQELTSTQEGLNIAADILVRRGHTSLKFGEDGFLDLGRLTCDQWETLLMYTPLVLSNSFQLILTDTNPGKLWSYRRSTLVRSPDGVMAHDQRTRSKPSFAVRFGHYSRSNGKGTP